MKIEAGEFADNQRLELFAYLVDVAGNVGGTALAPDSCQLEKPSRHRRTVLVAKTITNRYDAATDGH